MLHARPFTRLEPLSTASTMPLSPINTLRSEMGCKCGQNAYAVSCIERTPNQRSILSQVRHINANWNAICTRQCFLAKPGENIWHIYIGQHFCEVKKSSTLHHEERDHFILLTPLLLTVFEFCTKPIN